MKRMLRFTACAMLIGLVVLLPHRTEAQTREWETVESAIQVLQEISAIPAAGIPRAMMESAEGIAIIPNTVKLGFFVGGRRGRGVLAVRGQDGSWSNPVFTIITGGSFGYQFGIQATDVILVFRSRKSIDGILRGKFTLGADAAVAAGPLGRHAEAATDAWLKAEIYSYSRSRGLFAGVALEGSVLEIDSPANNAFYGKPGIAPVEIISGAGIAVPDAAGRLRQQLAVQAPSGRTVTGATAAGIPAAISAAPSDAESVRRELTTSIQRLYARLDDPWRQYLALPGEVFSARVAPNPQTVSQTLRRFDTVKADPRYRVVADMPEFQTAYLLLQRYVETAGPTSSAAATSFTTPTGAPALPATPATGGSPR